MCGGEREGLRGGGGVEGGNMEVGGFTILPDSRGLTKLMREILESWSVKGGDRVPIF